MKKTKSHDPKYSEGARVERKAFRGALRRRINKMGAHGEGFDVLLELIEWVLERQKRYDKRPGGL